MTIASALATTAVVCLSATQGPAHADVVVAIPAPLTGAQAPMGLSMQTAAGIIAADINAGGGVAGQSVRIVLHDDTCVSGSGVASARIIAASEAAAIIGHPCTASALAAGPFYASAGKLFIAAGTSHQQLTEKRASAWTFRLPAPGAPQANFLGRSIAATAPAGAIIALIRDKTQLNIATATRIEAALRAAGRTAIITETFTGGDKDFSVVAQKLAAAKVTHAAIIAFAVEGGLLATDLVKAMPQIEIYGTDALATRDFAQVAGPNASSRVNIALESDHLAYAPQNPRAKVLIDRMTAIGVPVHREALYLAAALEAWASAARKSVAPADVAAALPATVETLLGPVQFDIRGDAKLPLWSLYRWRDGILLPAPQQP